MTADPAALDALRGVDLFAGLSEPALAKVADKTRKVQHPYGKEITVEGEAGIGFHLITAGSADVIVGGEVAGRLGVGDCFGEVSLIDGLPRSATVRTTSEVTTLSMVAWDFAPLLDEMPELTKALLMAMCGRLRAAQSH